MFPLTSYVQESKTYSIKQSVILRGKFEWSKNQRKLFSPLLLSYQSDFQSLSNKNNKFLELVLSTWLVFFLHSVLLSPSPLLDYKLSYQHQYVLFI